MLEYEEKRIPLSQIDPKNMTFGFRYLGLDGKKLATLVELIRLLGLLYPLVVMKCGKKYVIVAGFRRYSALCVLAEADPKYAEVRCMVVTGEIDEVLRIAADENRERKTVSPMELACKILGLDHDGKSNTQIEAALGLTERSIQRYRSLLTCVDEVKEAVHEGQIEFMHGCALAQLPAGDQKRLLKSIVEKKLSTEDLRKEIRRLWAKRRGPTERWEALKRVLPDGAKFRVNREGRLHFHFEFGEPKDATDVLARLRKLVEKLEAGLAEAGGKK